MDELNGIKSRWSNRQNFFLQYEKDGVLTVAAFDINYLLNRLEAAEKAARGGVVLGRIGVLDEMIENMDLWTQELRSKKEHIKKEYREK